MDTNEGPEILRVVEGKWKTLTERVQTRGCEEIQSPDKADFKDKEHRIAGDAESHTYVNIIGARQGFLDDKAARGTVGVYSEPYSIDTEETYLTAVPEKQYDNIEALDGSRAGRPPKSDAEHVYSEPYTL